MTQQKNMNENEGEMGGSEPRIYEVGYHFVSNVSPDGLPAEAAKVKDAIASSGGSILSEEEPKLVALAYKIDKRIGGKRVWFDSAYFGWIKFETSPEALRGLKKFMEENENILRFLVAKTVRENTMVKKSLLSAKPPVVNVTEKEGEKVEPAAVPAPINEEELDKQIEELVIQ